MKIKSAVLLSAMLLLSPTTFAATAEEINGALTAINALLLDDTVDLKVAVTPSSVSVSKSGSVTYAVTITNDGSMSAKDVKLAFNTPPKTVSYISSDDTSNCVSNAKLTQTICTIAEIGSETPSNVVTKNITVTFQRKGGQSLTAQVSSASETESTANNKNRLTTKVLAN